MSKKTKIKKEAARKERLRQQKHHARLAPKSQLGLPVAVTPDMFPDDKHKYWLAHGVNYIVSNYEEGLWDPMFPSIYEGRPVTTDEMANAIVARFSSEGANWSKVGQAALAWSVINREIAYVYYLETLRRLKAKGNTDTQAKELADQPGHPVVWEVFRYLLDNMGKTKEMMKKGR